MSVLLNYVCSLQNVFALYNPVLSIKEELMDGQRASVITFSQEMLPVSLEHTGICHPVFVPVVFTSWISLFIFVWAVHEGKFVKDSTFLREDKRHFVAIDWTLHWFVLQNLFAETVTKTMRYSMNSIQSMKHGVFFFFFVFSVHKISKPFI